MFQLDPLPLVELQCVFLRVVNNKERSCTVVVIREPDYSRMLRQVHVDDDTTQLEPTEWKAEPLSLTIVYYECVSLLNSQCCQDAVRGSSRVDGRRWLEQLTGSRRPSL